MAALHQQSTRLSTDSAPTVAKEDTVYAHVNDKEDAENAHNELPSHLAPIEALGLEDWRGLEKKLVRRLDFTLMPCLWVSFFHPISLTTFKRVTQKLTVATRSSTSSTISTVLPSRQYSHKLLSDK